MTPEVPGYLLKPLPEPKRRIESNRDLLQLLADYESLRKRANADRKSLEALFLLSGEASID